MDEQADRDGQVWPTWWIISVIFTVAFVVYWPLRSEYLCDYDAPAFARAVEAFRVDVCSPYRPGYPLFVLAAAGMRSVVGDSNTALILLSIVFTAGAAVFFFQLARDLQGTRGAVWMVGLFLLTPNVILYSVMGATYSVDLFSSCLIGWFAARLWQGQKEFACGGAVICGLLAGFRFWGAVLMLPLYVCALLAGCRGDWRLYLKSVMFGGAGFFCWYVPLASFGGGIRRGTEDYWRGFVGLFELLERISVFTGIPAPIYLDVLVREAIWAGITLVIPTGLLLCLWSIRKIARLSTVPGVPRPAWHRPWFYAVWLFPNLFLITCIDLPKPGYLNLSLPPLLLCLGSLIWTNLRTLSWSGPKTTTWPYIVTAGVFLISTVTLVSFPFGKVSTGWFRKYRSIFQVASLQYVRESDKAVAQFHGLVETERTSNCEQMFMVLQPQHIVLRGDASNYYFPGCPQCELGEDGLIEHLRGERPYSSTPASTQRIWWNLPSSLSPDPILAALPETKLVLKGSLRSYYLTEIGARALDTQFWWEGHSYPLYRPVGVQFVRGFGEVETDANGRKHVWMMGPECELKIGVQRAMRIRVVLNVISSPIPRQRMTVSFNGADTRSEQAVESGSTIRFILDAHEGLNDLHLAFLKWNGFPSRVIPTDKRPVAVSLRQITLRLRNGEEVKLLAGS